MQRVAFICHGTFKREKKKKIPNVQAREGKKWVTFEITYFACAIISRREFKMNALVRRAFSQSLLKHT